MANKTAAQLITAARKRPMAPEKLNAVMLKVRKGATASLTFSNLVNIFDAIGWRIQPMTGWVPLHYMYDGRLWLVQKYARGSIETIKHDHERSKRAEAAMLPPKAKPGEHVIMEVSEIKEGANGFLFHQKEWVGAEGFTIRTADGKIVEYLPDHHSLGKPLDYGLYKLVDAIRKHGFVDAVNAALNMEAHAPAQPRSRDNTGTCGCCWGNYKLEGGRLVLHGYQRPGWGEIHGRCIGVGLQPLETSPETAKLMRKTLDGWIAKKKEFLARVAAGEVTEVSAGRLGTKIQWVKKGEPGFDRILEEHVKDARRELVKLEDDVELYDKILAKWRERPMPRDGELQRGPEFFTK